MSIIIGIIIIDLSFTVVEIFDKQHFSSKARYNSLQQTDNSQMDRCQWTGMKAYHLRKQ